MLSFSYFITRGFTQFITLALWWYSRGLFLVAKRLITLEKYELLRVGVHVWIRNFFVPMFHDYTLIGRLLSLFFRFFIIIGKSVRIVVTLTVRLIALAVWVLLPFILAGGLVNYFGRM